MWHNNQPTTEQGSAKVARGIQATAKMNAIVATVTLLLSIVLSSANGLGSWLPSSQRVVHCCVGPSTPFLSFCCPPFYPPALSSPALSDCPTFFTLASWCVIHHPIALQSVLRLPPLVVSFTTQLPCIAYHPLISHSPPPPSCCIVCCPLVCIVHHPLLPCHPLPAHPSHTLPQFSCCIPPIVVPTVLSSSIVEDQLMIVVCPPLPPATTTAKSLLCNLCKTSIRVFRMCFPRFCSRDQILK